MHGCFDDRFAFFLIVILEFPTMTTHPKRVAEISSFTRIQLHIPLPVSPQKFPYGPTVMTIVVTDDILLQVFKRTLDDSGNRIK